MVNNGDKPLNDYWFIVVTNGVIIVHCWWVGMIVSNLRGFQWFMLQVHASKRHITKNLVNYIVLKGILFILKILCIGHQDLADAALTKAPSWKSQSSMTAIKAPMSKVTSHIVNGVSAARLVVSSAMVKWKNQWLKNGVIIGNSGYIRG